MPTEDFLVWALHRDHRPYAALYLKKEDAQLAAERVLRDELDREPGEWSEDGELLTSSGERTNIYVGARLVRVSA